MEETPAEDENAGFQRYLLSVQEDKHREPLAPGEAFNRDGTPADTLRGRMLRRKWNDHQGCYVNMCNICGKEATPGHLESVGHRKNEVEYILVRRLFGETSGIERGGRRQGRPGGVCGHPGLLRQDLILAFWGSRLADLPSLVMEKFRKQGTLEVVKGKGRRSTYSADRVAKVRLAMVSYSGTGKYKPGQPIRFWDDIPANDVVFRD